MSDRWRPVCRPPRDLVVPSRVDPRGVTGPTRGQARGPSWRRTSPRLYVPASVDEAVAEQRVLEAAQRLPAGGAVSGWAALRMWGGGFFDGRESDGRTPRPVLLVVPPPGNLRPWGGTVTVRDRIPADEIVVRHGVPCAVPVRAAFDEARRLAHVRDAVVVVDMALAAGLFTMTEFTTYAARRDGWPGAGTARSAARLADPRSLSPGETWMRLVWRLDAGLEQPLSNWPVADLDGHRLGRPDLLCVERGVVGEYNGADHASNHRRARDHEREDLFRGVGLEYFTVVGPDRADVPKVVARMRAACARAERAGRPRRWLLARDPGPL